MPYSEFVYRRRVQFPETDASGIVHFTNFFKYVEEAEHAMWRAAGVSINTHDRGIGWPRVAASFEFKKPLRFEDEFDVHISVAAKTQQDDPLRGGAQEGRGRARRRVADDHLRPPCGRPTCQGARTSLPTWRAYSRSSEAFDRCAEAHEARESTGCTRSVTQAQACEVHLVHLRDPCRPFVVSADCTVSRCAARPCCLGEPSRAPGRRFSTRRPSSSTANPRNGLTPLMPSHGYLSHGGSRSPSSRSRKPGHEEFLRQRRQLDAPGLPVVDEPAPGRRSPRPRSPRAAAGRSR